MKFKNNKPADCQSAIEVGRERCYHACAWLFPALPGTLIARMCGGQSTVAHLVLCAALAVALFAGAPAAGHVVVSGRFAETQVLLHEPARLRVTVLNNSGRMMVLDGGHEGADLLVEVERIDGRIIRRRSAQPLVAYERIVSGDTGVFDFNLTQLFHITERGTYKVRALLEWGRTVFVSADITLEIVSGFELARLKAGVAGDMDALRVYVLEYLQRPTGESLYLRIEDDRSKAIIGVFNLGSMVRTRPPELLLDESGNIHVLFLSKNMIFVHAAFTPYGVALLAEEYPSVSGATRLRRDAGGRVVVHLPPPPELPVPPPPPPEKKRRGLWR